MTRIALASAALLASGLAATPAAAEVWVGRVKTERGTWPHLVYAPEGATCAEYWNTHTPNAKKLAVKHSVTLAPVTLGSGTNLLCDLALPTAPVELFGILNAITASSLVFESLDDWDARVGRLAAMLDHEWNVDWGKQCTAASPDVVALYEDLLKTNELARCTQLAVGGSKAGLGRMDEYTFVTFANEMHASGHKQSLQFVENWFNKTVLPQLVYCAIASHQRDPVAVKLLKPRFPQLWQGETFVGGDPQVTATLAGTLLRNFEGNRVMQQLGAAWVRTKVETEKGFESVKRGTVELGDPGMAQYVLNAMALGLIDKALFATDDGSIAKTLGGSDTDWTAKQLPIVKCLPLIALPRDGS